MSQERVVVPFSDEQCMIIIRTWFDGPCGTIWCRQARKSPHQDTRICLELTEEGSREWWRDEDSTQNHTEVVRVDIVPQRIREAIAALIVSGSRGLRQIASNALVNPTTDVDAYHADVIVQQAVFGRVVFG